MDVRREVWQLIGERSRTCDMTDIPDDPKYTWHEACVLGIVKTYVFKLTYWHPDVDSYVEWYIPARSESDAWDAVNSECGEYLNPLLVRIDGCALGHPCDYAYFLANRK
jgi:hypothetical protein